MKELEAQKAAAEAVVVVTDMLKALAALICFVVFSTSALSAVLPEDRADVMYHSYDGGEITIDGPAVLVRKSVTEDMSVSAQYYVDQISSASIDVQLAASPYTEERTEYNLSADYLINKTIVSGGYTKSSENDYEAETLFVGVSQDFFGDLSTLSLNYAKGSDVVGMSTDPEFEEDTKRQSYQISWTQVVTKNLLMNFVFHIITDEGFLNNPYRSVRYVDDSQPNGFALQQEVYPETRTSQAVAVRGKYFMPYRAAFSFEYRRFNDTWNINAYNLETGYIHPIGEHWTLDFKYRYYAQDDADFYSDLFPKADAQNFLARDKELSDFNSNSFSAAVSYEMDIPWTSWLEKGSVNLAWTHIRFDYNNFRDATATGYSPGEEPLYSMEADVIRFFISAWF